jgi:hypothetical protein
VGGAGKEGKKDQQRIASHTQGSKTIHSIPTPLACREVPSPEPHHPRPLPRRALTGCAFPSPGIP